MVPLIGAGKYYFAYGHNLRKLEMAERCPDSQPLCVAIAQNNKLMFGGSSLRWGLGGVATLIPSLGNNVIGAVYQVSEQDLILLDKYEGFYNKIFTRKPILVIDTMGNRIWAIIHFIPEPFSENVPSQDYLNMIKQGYRDWSIDEHWNRLDEENKKQNKVSKKQYIAFIEKSFKDERELKIFKRIRKILVDKFDIEETEVAPETKIEDLRLNILELVDFIEFLEREFSRTTRKIEIPDVVAEKMTTVKDIIDYYISITD